METLTPATVKLSQIVKLDAKTLAVATNLTAVMLVSVAKPTLKLNALSSTKILTNVALASKRKPLFAKDSKKQTAKEQLECFALEPCANKSLNSSATQSKMKQPDVNASAKLDTNASSEKSNNSDKEPEKFLDAKRLLSSFAQRRNARLLMDSVSREKAEFANLFVKEFPDKNATTNPTDHATKMHTTLASTSGERTIVITELSFNASALRLTAMKSREQNAEQVFLNV
jgi:hypothetical protein